MFNIGDIVKTNDKDKKFSGRIGEIVKSVITKNSKFYTIQFPQNVMYDDYFTGGLYEYPEDYLIFVKESKEEMVDKFQVGVKVIIQNANYHGEILERCGKLVHILSNASNITHHLISELKLADEQELTGEDNREITAVQNELNIFPYDIGRQHSILVTTYKKWKKK